VGGNIGLDCTHIRFHDLETLRQGFYVVETRGPLGIAPKRFT
jgi:hypothetical protein